MSIFQALTIDRWIAVAASFGTLIAAIIAAFSVREVRLQRSQQFQPRITPTIATYKLIIDPVNLVSFGTQIEKYLPIINVGHGVATDLTVTWDINIDLWINKINTLSAQRGAGIGVEFDAFGLAYRYKGKTTGGTRLPAVEFNHFPYIVPVTTNHDPTKAVIPGSIVALLNAYYWSYFRDAEPTDQFYRNPSPEFRIHIQLGYKDTVGRAYTRKSILSVSALLECDRDDKDKPMQVDFNIQPISNEPAEGYSTWIKVLSETSDIFERLTRLLVR